MGIQNTLRIRGKVKLYLIHLLEGPTQLYFAQIKYILIFNYDIFFICMNKESIAY